MAWFDVITALPSRDSIRSMTSTERLSVQLRISACVEGDRHDTRAQ